MSRGRACGKPWSRELCDEDVIPKEADGRGPREIIGLDGQNQSAQRVLELGEDMSGFERKSQPKNYCRVHTTHT